MIWKECSAVTRVGVYESWQQVRIDVDEEEVELKAQGSGQWTSYYARILDENGVALPRDFVVTLTMLGELGEQWDVASVALNEDVYDRATGKVKIAFQVPNAQPQNCLLKLRWEDQALWADDTVVYYLRGSSYGADFKIAEEREVVVTDESTDISAQGKGQWVSYYATVLDSKGEKLPDDFVASLTLDNIEVVSFSLVPDLYKDGKLALAFKVPEDISETEYKLGLRWRAQPSRVTEVKYLEGSSPGVSFKVAIESSVKAENEWVEKTTLRHGETTSYHVTIYDAETLSGLPENFVITLMLDETKLFDISLAPNVYDPATREARIAFTIPYGISAGTHRIWIKWKTQVITEKIAYPVKFFEGSSSGTLVSVS